MRARAQCGGGLLCKIAQAASLALLSADPRTISWADIVPGAARPARVAMQAIGAPAPPPNASLFLDKAVQHPDKTDATVPSPHPLLRFGAGAIGSAAQAQLITVPDAAMLLAQLQHGPGHLLTLALHAFQETGDIGELVRAKCALARGPA